MTLAEFIVSVLRDGGVRTIFGVPGGGGNLDVIDAARRVGLPFVLTTTECGAVMAAIAQAEISGAPGACLTTLGPGAASAVNGVACAYLERAPVFVFTDSLADTLRAMQHQRLNHELLLRAVTKYSGSLPENPGQVMTHAVGAVSQRPSGPVHIDCPGDLGVAASPLAHLWTKELSSGGIAPRDRLRLESMLRDVQKPLLIAGLGARRPDDVAAIRAFCDRHGVPALVTYKAKGVVPDDHPWFAGLFTNAALERPLLEECDLILAAGLDPVEFLPRPWPNRKPILYCGDPLPDGPGQMPVPFVLGAITKTLEAVGEYLGPAQWDRAAIRRGVDASRAAIDVRAEGLTAQQVVATTAVRLAGRCRVTVDAGAHMFPATMLWLIAEPNEMLISNGLSTMGFALPAAIGAALIDRARPVVALTGDGGLLMCVGELATAVRERLKIIVVVFKDASLSLIEIKQQARQLAPAGVALGEIDWPGIAKGFGLAAWTAASTRELDAALEAAEQIDGPSLIEARIDRSNYSATMKAIRG